jgi:choline dehydrogenase-like flavoprotein
MPVITAPKSQAQYDIIVIGSGAGGGQAAYVAAMEGAKVLMLEAGLNYDPARPICYWVARSTARRREKRREMTCEELRE